MSEVVRDLVVSLSPDAGEFRRKMRDIHASIKEAASAFRLAGAGVGNPVPPSAASRQSCPASGRCRPCRMLR